MPTAEGQARDQSYCYHATTRRLEFLRAASGGCPGGAAQVYFDFDEQGNLKNKNGQGYLFSQDNRLREAVGKERYHYDANGRRVESEYGGVNIRSFYSQAGQLLYQSDGRRSNSRAHVYLAGSLVATRQQAWSGAVTLKFHHTDALGTPVAVTDTSRAVIERSQYDPYGKVLNRPHNDTPGYTGHVEDAQTGLTYMQQRYYDPLVGRFLSVDPVTAYSSPVGAFNRYWYANNNPYKFKDPDGRKCTTTDGKDSCTFDEFKDKKGDTISREQALSSGSKVAKFLGADRGSRILRAEAGMTAKYSAAKALAAKGGEVTIKGKPALGIPDQKVGGSAIVSQMETIQTIANESSNPNSNSIASVKADLKTGGPAKGPIDYWKDGSAGSDMGQVFGHEILHTIYSGVGVPNKGFANPTIDHQVPFDEASDDIQ